MREAKSYNGKPIDRKGFNGGRGWVRNSDPNGLTVEVNFPGEAPA